MPEANSKAKIKIPARAVVKVIALLALVLFALPFLTVSCGSNNVANLSGYDLAFGVKKFITGSWRSLPAHFSLILAIVCLVAIFILSFMKTFRFSLLLWGLSSIVGIVCLIVFYSNIYSEIETGIAAFVTYNINDLLATKIGVGFAGVAVCYALTFVFFCKKLFFEDPDPVKIKVDESDIYYVLKKEEKEEIIRKNEEARKKESEELKYDGAKDQENLPDKQIEPQKGEEDGQQ